MGKRGDGPALRRGQHLQDARDALGSWRTRTFLRRYSTSPFTDVGILPDKILTSLASKRIRSLDEMAEKLAVPWMFSQRHGEEVIEVLRCLDHARLEQKAQAAQAKKAAKRKETEAFRVAEQLKKKLAAAAKPPRGRMSRKRHPQSPSQRIPPRQPLAASPEHVNVSFQKFQCTFIHDLLNYSKYQQHQFVYQQRHLIRPHSLLQDRRLLIHTHPRCHTHRICNHIGNHAHPVCIPARKTHICTRGHFYIHPPFYRQCPRSHTSFFHRLTQHAIVRHPRTSLNQLIHGQLFKPPMIINCRTPNIFVTTI